MGRQMRFYGVCAASVCAMGDRPGQNTARAARNLHCTSNHAALGKALIARLDLLKHLLLHAIKLGFGAVKLAAFAVLGLARGAGLDVFISQALDQTLNSAVI